MHWSWLSYICSAMIKYFIAWFPMLLIAIINGAIREALFKKYVSEQAAHRLSTITLLIFFGFFIWFVMRKYPPESGQQALFVGFLWVVLTLLFEFGFGLSRGRSWNSLIGEYDVFKGKLWLLVPLWLGISPYLFFILQRTHI